MKCDQKRFWKSAPKRQKAAKIQAVLGYVQIGMSIIQGIVLVPLYLRFIEVRLYGLWLASGGITVWLGLLDLGIGGLMGQRISAAYGEKNSDRTTLYYFNGLILQLTLLVLMVAVSAALAWFLPGLLGANISEARVLVPCIFLSGISLGLTNLNYGQLGAIFALQRPLIPLLNNLVGSVVTIGVITFLLFRGSGLYSIAIGMVSGSFVSFSLNLFYGYSIFRKIGTAFYISRVVLNDMIHLIPSIIVGKTGNALAGRIEPTLITLMITPEMAVSYSLTKRAADIIKMLLDKVVGSVFFGFAHLYAERDFVKCRWIFRQLSFGLYAVGLVGLGTYIATNRSFISVWAGEQFFAGQGITVLMGFSVFLLVFNNFFARILGATGDIAQPAVLTGMEALIRVLIMACMLPWLGIRGLPIAILLSGIPLIIIYFFRLKGRLQLKLSFGLGWGFLIRLGLPAIIIGGAFTIGWFIIFQSWQGFIALALAVAAISTFFIFLFSYSYVRQIVLNLNVAPKS